MYLNSKETSLESVGLMQLGATIWQLSENHDVTALEIVFTPDEVVRIRGCAGRDKTLEEYILPQLQTFARGKTLEASFDEPTRRFTTRIVKK